MSNISASTVSYLLVFAICDLASSPFESTKKKSRNRDRSDFMVMGMGKFDVVVLGAGSEFAS